MKGVLERARVGRADAASAGGSERTDARAGCRHARRASRSLASRSESEARQCLASRGVVCTCRCLLYRDRRSAGNTVIGKVHVRFPSRALCVLVRCAIVF